MMNVAVYVFVCIIMAFAVVIGGAAILCYVLDNAVSYDKEWIVKLIGIPLILAALVGCVAGEIAIYTHAKVVDTQVSKVEMATVNGATWGENTYARSTGKHSAKMANELVVYLKNSDGTVQAHQYPLDTKLVVDGGDYVVITVEQHRNLLVHYDVTDVVLHVSE